MKQYLPTKKNSITNQVKKLIYLVSFLAVSIGFAQSGVTINKTIVPNATICNNFDVQVRVVGVAPVKPQEVVLVIDRSGSMGNGGNPKPIVYAKNAAIDFVNNIFLAANNPTGNNKVSIVSFADSANTDIVLTGSAGKSNIIAAINALVASGNTNTEAALIKARQELVAHGTFDCLTARNIIFLSDGLPTRSADGTACGETSSNTVCQQRAIAAGMAAQNINVGGTNYNTSVFSIGLIGAISGATETLAISVLNQIQNAGLYTTENNADLNGIYADILNRINYAAQQDGAQAFIDNPISSGFEVVPGSISSTKGTTTYASNTLSWFVPQVVTETIFLRYRLRPTTADDNCGQQNPSNTIIRYRSGTTCQIVTQTVPSPQVCVPCPRVQTAVVQAGCTSFSYDGTFNQGICGAFTSAFRWDFFLGTTLIGTSNTLDGTFTYTGTDPFVGQLRCVLTFTGTGGAGCTVPNITSQSIITLPPPPTATATITNVSCNGGSDGAIDITPTGGQTPFTYVWTRNGSPISNTTQDLNNIPAGNYSVTITGANGCGVLVNTGLIVTEPTALDATVAVTNATATGLCLNGSATANPTGGTPGYTYLWSATANNQTTQTASNLPNGNHSVRITDSKGCFINRTITISCIPNCDTQISNPTITNVTCNGLSNGSIAITASSALNNNATFNFIWNTVPAGAPIQINNGVTSSTLANRPAGNYTVSVTINGSLCTPITRNYTITQPPVLSSEATTITPVSCRDGANGAIDLTVNGGTPNYTYSWTRNGNPISNTTQDLTGLTAGTYAVMITDANGCTATNSFDVTQPANGLSATATITSVGCFGASTGAIDLEVAGGTPGYSYSWSNGSTTQDITGLLAGDYIVTITDSNSCTLVKTYTVGQPASALSLMTTDVDILCAGASTGSIDLTVTGGTPPYNYLWSNGSTTQDLSAIPAGVYNVTVTDANGCAAVLPVGVNISQPEPVTIVITKTNATTGQACANGTATATATGGVAPYTFIWSSGTQANASANPNLVTGLSNGTHSVTVTDANGCISTQSVVIDCTNTCDAVIIVNSITDVLCTGLETGSATVGASSVANPNARFTFTWSENDVIFQTDANATTSTINAIGAGVYKVSVTIDGTVCSPVEQSITITEPQNALNVTVITVDENGPTTNDGTATANVTGGTTPYTYLWSPGGETTQVITGLDEGTYTVTVTDANGCTTMGSGTINPVTCQNLSVSTQSVDVSCNGASDGSVTANISGGAQGTTFSYSWAPGGATTQTVNNLSGGTYTVTVTDLITQCTASSTVTVNEPNVLTSEIAINDVACFGDATGSLDLTVTGGTQPYSFLWSPNGETSEDIVGLLAGTYSVTITDANGCITTNSETVDQPVAPLSLQIDNQVDSVCGALGSVTVSASGGTPAYTYNLDGGLSQSTGTFNGLIAGNYTINVIDGNNCSTSIAIAILSNCTTAVDDINNTYVNTPVSGNVLTNDDDAEGDTQTVTSLTVTTVQGVAVTIAADGTYTYTPPTDYVGGDSFVYTVCDSGSPQACDSATVYIEVQPDPTSGNEPPVANADTNTTEVGVPVSGTVTSNDFDPDGDAFTVTGNTPPSNGTLLINPDGTYTYTPNPGFTGEDTFTYTICETDQVPALCDTATVTIQVVPDTGNLVVANDDAYNGATGTDLTGNVLDNDFDPEGDAFTVTGNTQPTNGTVTLSPTGDMVYTPTPGYSGPDSFTYTITDANGATDTATVYLTVAPNNNTTTAVDDINNTYVNTPVSGNVLTNDDDAEGDTQTVTSLTVTTVQGVTVTIAADGTYTYTPPTDYVGGDSFVYTVCDSGSPQACDSATVYIEVQPDPTSGNEPPVANADTNTTEVGVPVSGTVTSNDFDPDGDAFTVTGNTPPSNGTLLINPDGTYTYTPNPGFTGEDTFTYTICETDQVPALCDTATVTIQVVPDTGNLVVANDDAYNGATGTDLTGNVLDNDFDPEGDAFTVTGNTQPTNGTVTLSPTGDMVYTPTPGYSGPDSFTYTITDANGATDTATVYLTVAPNNNTTTAVDDINNTYVNTPVSGNVLTNDDDAEGDTQTVTSLTVTTVQGVTVTIAADGTYTYTPPTDYVGGDSFVYTVCDSGSPQACDSATVYIEVQPDPTSGNEPPVANADTNTTEVGVPVSGTVTSNDFDPDGDAFTVTGNTPPSNGTLLINPDGTYTYTPNPGFTGEDTFTYTICETDQVPALCDTATVTIQVVPDTGNLVVANDDAYNGATGTDLTGNVLDNDFDPEGDAFTVTGNTQPTNGTVTLSPTGDMVYTPTPGYSGPDSFTYTITDANGATDTATVYLTVAPNNNVILAVDDINNTFINLAVSGNVLTNDDNTDGPAGTEVVTLISGPTAGGTLVLNSDGTYTYTPPTDFVGFDTFVYQVCDGGSPIACDMAIVTIEVIANPILGNDPPIANNDTGITEVNTPVNGNILVNDFDPDNDTITITGNTQPSNGNVVVNADGTYTYTPNIDFIGEDSFTYVICDDGTPSLCDGATVTIQVIPNNGNVTVANDDAFSGEVNIDIVGNVLSNDTDPEMDAQSVNISVSPLSGPTNGTVVFNGTDGTFTYTPNTGFIGTDQFIYQVCDNGSPVACDQATVYITIRQTPAPAIAIVKTAVFNDEDQDGCTDVDETLTYTFEVSNPGNVPLNNINITDALFEAPNALVTIEFVNGDNNGNDLLDIDETWSYTANYTITQADIDLGSVTNQATVEGTDPDGTIVTDVSGTTTTTDDSTVVVLCQNDAIALVKTGVFNDEDQDGCSDVDETITYAFTVTNEGNTTISGVTVTDDLLGGLLTAIPTGDTNNDGNLDVTETWVYVQGYNVTQADIDLGSVTNTATVNGTGATGPVTDVSGTTTTTDDSTVVVLCQNDAIALVKTGVFNDEDQDGCSDVDETITYAFTVTNEGNTTISGVTVTDDLLGGLLTAIPTGDTNNDGNLDVTETWVYVQGYNVTQADIDLGSVTNTATVNGTGATGPVTDVSGTTTTTDDSTVVVLCQNDAIALVKTGVFNDEDQDGCSDVDETITYAFTVTNEGNTTISGVTVTDDLLGGLLTAIPTGDTNGNGNLDVTETWVYVQGYNVTQADIDLGSVTNTATVNGTGATGPVTDVSGTTTTTDDSTVVVLCQNDAIALVKTGVFNDEDQDGCSDVDETITYAFTVTNEGNTTISGVTVTDDLLGGLLTAIPTGDTNGNGNLDVTETWVYVQGYNVTQADIDLGSVTNTATVNGTGATGPVTDVSGTTTTTDDSTVVVLCQNDAIALVKTGVFNDEDQDGCSDVDETITYAFTVTNEGNTTISGVTVTDDLLGGLLTAIPTGDTNGNGNLDVTETWVYVQGYNVTQADIDLGSVTNTATVNGTGATGPVTDVSGTTTTTDDSTVVVLCQNFGIALIKTGVVSDTDGDGCADVKETITYTFTVVNTGNTTLTNVSINDPLVNVQGGPITLAPGQTDNISFIAIYPITQADIDLGNVTNQATVFGTTSIGTIISDLSDDNSFTEDDPTVTPLCQLTGIALIKVGTPNDENGDGCLGLGETIDYTFTITNLGNVRLSNITVTDDLITVIGDPISLIVGGVDVSSFSGTYTVTQTDIDNGFVQNQATVTGFTPNGDVVTDLSDNNSNLENDPTVTVLCQNPSIDITKSGVFNDENNNLSADVGESISYIFTVTNTGDVTLFNVTITDPLPGIEIFGGPIPQLLPGETDSTTFTAEYNITQTDIDNLEVVNQATVSAQDIAGNEITDLSDDPNNPDDIDANGDGNPDDPTVVILPLVDSTFEIFNGITPDGDGLNDFFQIIGIENFPDNNMQIFNRWGVLIYETNGYGGSDGRQSVFTGISEGRVTIQQNKELPSGTYYYILVRKDPNTGETLKNNGYLYINR